MTIPEFIDNEIKLKSVCKHTVFFAERIQIVKQTKGTRLVYILTENDIYAHRFITLLYID